MQQVQPGVHRPGAVGGIVAAEVRILGLLPDWLLAALAQCSHEPESAAQRLFGVEEGCADGPGHDHVIPRQPRHLELVHRRQLPVDAVVRPGQGEHAVPMIGLARLRRPHVVIEPETTVDIEHRQVVAAGLQAGELRQVDARALQGGIDLQLQACGRLDEAMVEEQLLACSYGPYLSWICHYFVAEFFM